MSELRKLLRLAKSAYAITIPTKYREHLGLKFGDYIEIELLNSETITVKKHQAKNNQ